MLREGKDEILGTARGNTCLWNNVYSLSDELAGETGLIESWWEMETHTFGEPLSYAYLVPSI